MTAFQTPLSLFQQITLSMKAINFPAQFSRIVMRVLEFCIPKDCEMYFDDISCKDSKTKYNEKEILSEIQHYVFEHLQCLNHVLVNIEMTGAKAADEKLK